MIKPGISDHGVAVQRPEGEFVFKGSVLIVVADNLAAHSIGGFLESFSSLHPCRFCLISKSSIKNALHCDSLCLRTQDSYASQVQRVTKKKTLQKVYGLKQDSFLNSIPNFHVTSGLPSDIMHDLYEGIACDILEHILKYCVMSEFITLETLNKMIAEFPYVGSDKVNKPDTVPVPMNVFQFSQTAAKTRCCLRLLPLMIGHKIPFADSKWEVLLLLLDVHDIVMSPVMSTKDTVLLDDAVCTFLEKFLHEFPNETFKPKMHFLTHYGSHCRMFGPMVNYFSFRFESKHGYFKELACRMKCRRNVLQTFARKHQYLHSWHLQCSGSYLYRDISSTGGKCVAVDSLRECIKAAIRPAVGDVNMLFQVNTVIVDGITYSLDMAIVTGVCDDNISLSRICAVFIVDGAPVFICCRLVDQVYQRHFHSYSFSESASYHHLRVTDLADPFPLCIYKCASVHSDLCIVLKHSLSCGQ